MVMMTVSHGLRPFTLIKTLVAISTLLKVTEVECYSLEEHRASADADLSWSVSNPSGGSLHHSLNKVFRGIVRKRREEHEERNDFSDVEKSELTYLHNAYRSAVVPTATYMNELEWSEDIAKNVAAYVQQCRLSIRAPTVGKWTRMTENYYKWPGNQAIVTDSVHYWSNNQTSSSNKMKVASHTMFGCGISSCANFDENRDEDVKGYFLFCAYSSSYKNPPYEQGPPCTKCPEERPKCRYNLCVTEDMLEGCRGYNGSMQNILKERNTTKSDSLYCKGFEAPDQQKKSPPSEITETKKLNLKAKQSNGLAIEPSMTGALFIAITTLILIGQGENS